MEQRYLKLNSQEGMLYTEGSPIVIQAGTILYDTLTKKVLAQLKFKNISNKEISSLTACIQPLDDSGEEKESVVEYRYSDLSIGREGSFGSNTAVVLPNTTRSYKVRVELVCFADGSQWQGPEEYFASFPAPKRLEDAFDDEELAHQFRICYGDDCNYLSSEAADLWFCTCGAVNHADESKCHRCRRVHSALKNINIAALRSESSKRLTSEKIQEAEEDVENSERRSKLIKLIAILLPIVLIVTVLLATLPGYFRRKNNYAKAGTLLEQGQYDAAEQLYTELGEYEDSRELVEKEIPYRKAAYIMDCAARGDTDGLVMLALKRSEMSKEETVSTVLYRKASEMFAALGDYKDSAEQTAAAEKAIADYYEGLLADRYDAAVKLLEEKKFCEARDAFSALGDYKDSQEMVSECMVRKAELLLGLTEKYSMDGIGCSLSTVTGEKSVFYIPQEVYIKLGSGISTDIRSICAPDGVEINYQTPPEGCLPFFDAVSALSGTMISSKDGDEPSAPAEEAGDPTETFYAFIEEGKLPEAFTWLSEFTGDFPERDLWMNLMNLYLPFCGDWEFDSGDPTLFPRTMGVDTPCSMFTAAIFLSEDGTAKLRICMDGDPDRTFELQSNLEKDSTVSFYLSPDGFTTFYLVINKAGMINYSQYSNIPLPGAPQSVVYRRMA